MTLLHFQTFTFTLQSPHRLVHHRLPLIFSCNRLMKPFCQYELVPPLLIPPKHCHDTSQRQLWRHPLVIPPRWHPLHTPLQQRHLPTNKKQQSKHLRQLNHGSPKRTPARWSTPSTRFHHHLLTQDTHLHKHILSFPHLIRVQIKLGILQPLRPCLHQTTHTQRPQLRSQLVETTTTLTLTPLFKPQRLTLHLHLPTKRKKARMIMCTRILIKSSHHRCPIQPR